MKTITFITGSRDKFIEVEKILSVYDITLMHTALDLPEIQTTDARAIIEAKLQEAQKHMEGDLIVEDTSLYMDALGGLPGPFIKWFLQTLGVEKLARITLDLNNTHAQARTLIGYRSAQGEIRYFEGEVVGEIVIPRVKEGFGWDLMFIPNGYTKTFAEMTKEEKNKISMRAEAAKKFGEFLLKN